MRNQSDQGRTFNRRADNVATRATRRWRIFTAHPLVTASILGLLTVVVVGVVTIRTPLTSLDGFIIGLLFVILEALLLLMISSESLSPTLGELGKQSDGIRQTLEELERRHILLSHQEIALSDPVLRGEYQRIVAELSRRLSDLASGHFVREIDDVPQLSIEIVQSLNSEAFATVVVDKTYRYFNSVSGRKFLNQCYSKAKKMNRFTRLFIIQDFVDVTFEVYTLMEEHAREGIKVLVATSAELVNAGLNPEEDFGLWDRHYLIHLESPSDTGPMKMTVQVGEPYVGEAYRKIAQYTDVALTWDEFREAIRAPRNQQWWRALMPQRGKLPAPAGPSEEDVRTMWEQACRRGHTPQRALVLGYTELIVEEFARHDCQVEILDISNFQPQSADQRRKFHTGNWLNWRPDNGEKYDVILGDDVLSNLGIWQFHIFFNRMAGLLNPSALLIMRTSGEYRKPTEPLPTFERVLSELMELHTVSESLVYAKCWPMFHGPPFYDDRSRSFDAEDWNRKLAEVEQLPGQLSRLRLYHTGQSQHQTSPPIEELLKHAEQWLNLVDQSDVDESYVRLERRLKDYYRILIFAPKPS